MNLIRVIWNWNYYILNVLVCEGAENQIAHDEENQDTSYMQGGTSEPWLWTQFGSTLPADPIGMNS